MSWDKITEQQNSASANIDENSTLEILSIINDEDAGVALAIQNKLSEIEAFIKALIPRVKGGGRLFYVGSGPAEGWVWSKPDDLPLPFAQVTKWKREVFAGVKIELLGPLEGEEINALNGLRLL